MDARRRRFSIGLTGALIALALPLAGVGPVRAADPTPTAPMTVRFEAGRHTGYRFDASWNVISSKTPGLSSPGSATATGRKALGSRGTFLRISTGTWAGTWVRESGLTYVRGATGLGTYAPAARIGFPAGRYIGYAFSSTWKLTGTNTATLSSATSDLADRRAVVDGRRYVRMASGPWAGLWIPRETSAPSPIRCTTGARATGTRQVLSTVPNAGHEIALTFDLGGRVDPAISIMEYLLLERICTTVFPTGDTAATTVGRAVMAMIKANPAIFEVGNHTQNHCNLRDGGGGSGCPTGKPTAAFIGSELTTAGATIQELTGQSPVPYWRPPYGAYDTATLTAAAAVGYTKTLMWSIDTIDWRPVANDPPGPTAIQLATKIRTYATDGGIVLMHLGGFTTRNGLPWAVAGLREAGYRTTSISDLFRPG